jgi:hypothetical protein
VNAAYLETKKAADFVNASIHDFENREKMAEFKDDIYGLQLLNQHLVQPHRKFIAEVSSDKMLWLREGKRKKKVRLLLFSDMLMIVNRKNRYKTHFLFTEDPIPWIDDKVDYDCQMTHDSDNLCEQCKRMFQLITKETVHTFLAESEQIRIDFSTKIHCAIDHLCQNNPSMKIASRADPIAQQGVISLIKKRKFSFTRKKSEDYSEQYFKFQDTVPPSPQNIQTTVKRERQLSFDSIQNSKVTENILGLNLFGINKLQRLDTRQIQTARQRPNNPYQTLDPATLSPPSSQEQNTMTPPLAVTRRRSRSYTTLADLNKIRNSIDEIENLSTTVHSYHTICDLSVNKN